MNLNSIVGEGNAQSKEFSTLCFGLANPVNEPDFYSVPKLLHRVAEHIAQLGDDVVVMDINLHTKITADGYEPSIQVYYFREKNE
jgi:hypothetical protein